jgi:hypothetical protein
MTAVLGQAEAMLPGRTLPTAADVFAADCASISMELVTDVGARGGCAASMDTMARRFVSRPVPANRLN